MSHTGELKDQKRQQQQRKGPSHQRSRRCEVRHRHLRGPAGDRADAASGQRQNRGEHHGLEEQAHEYPGTGATEDATGDRDGDGDRRCDVAAAHC